MKTRPWTMLLVMMAGWLNRHQQDVIEYLREENKILREKIGKKQILLNDNQKIRSRTTRLGFHRLESGRKVGMETSGTNREGTTGNTFQAKQIVLLSTSTTVLSKEMILG